MSDDEAMALAQSLVEETCTGLSRVRSKGGLTRTPLFRRRLVGRIVERTTPANASQTSEGPRAGHMVKPPPTQGFR
jgi:hypothetical protein